MADKHPYISGAGPIVKTIQHFRRSLPGTIDAATIKKLGLAANNETYIINILRFINIIDDAGAPTTEAKKTFTQHDDQHFAAALGVMVKSAYKDLFALHGDEAWKLESNSLITYFRQTDQTSVIVGTRQANTFLTLSALCGHQELPQTRGSRETKPKNEKATAVNKPAITQVRQTPPAPIIPPAPPATGNVGLTVRIEVNLPAGGDQATYDRIFKSIRENLLNG